MKLRELRLIVREAADDTVKPFLWSDAFIAQTLNEGEVQACRRARLLVDSSTTEVCRITLTADKELYDIDPRVIFIRRVKLSTTGVPIGFARVRDMDEAMNDWESETGTVVGWVPDFTSGKLRLYRTPTSAEVPATLTLTVVREPLEPMTDDDHQPEIRPRHQHALQHWALFRMFSKRDLETYDPQRAADHLALFEAEFGPASTAVDEQWIDQNYNYSQDIGVR